MRLIFNVLLLILFAGSGVNISLSQNIDEITFTVLRDNESFTIIFPGTGEVLFNDISIDVSAPNGDVNRFHLNSIFSSLNGSPLQLPVCLRAQLQASQFVLPQQCSSLPDDRLYLANRAGIDLFWINRGTNQFYDLVFHKGEQRIGDCRSDQVNDRACRISYTPISALTSSPETFQNSIVFQRRVAYNGTDSNYDLYVAHQMLNNEWVVQPLLEGEFNDIYPSVSPDGSRIAFNSNRSGGLDLFLLNSDGSGEPIQITDVNADDATFEWSKISWNHTGDRLAFTRSIYDATDGWNYQLHIISIANSSMSAPLTDSPLGISDPTWSPDGRYILYSKYLERYRSTVEDSRNLRNVWVYDLTRDIHYELLGGALDTRESTWSPDGNNIVFVRDVPGTNCEIFRVDVSPNADGLLIASNEYRLTDNTSCDWEPAYSRDGTQIAYYANQIQSIRIMDAQLGDRLPTTSFANFRGDPILQDHWPSWMP